MPPRITLAYRVTLSVFLRQEISLIVAGYLAGYNKMHNKALTLIEILLVAIIVGILATISLPLFEKTKERGLDKAAQANLKLIQAAEKVYHIDAGIYLDCSNATCVNNNLKLSIPTGSNRTWNYNTVTTVSSFTGRASRYGATPRWSRTWSLTKDADEPSCSGSGCP